MLTVLLLVAGSLHAKEPKTIVAHWRELPAAVEGRELVIERKEARTIVGRLASIDDTGITIEQSKRKRGSITIPRREIQRMLASRKQVGFKGRAIGLGVAGAINLPILLTAARYANNEGGLGPTITAALVVVTAGTVAAGYALGWSADRARIRVDIPDLAK